MNAISPLSEFDEAMKAAQIVYTQEQIREIAISALMRQSGSGRTLHEIEHIKDHRVYNDYSLVGTVLAPVVTALHARGVMIPYTLGELQKVLEFDDDEMHYVICDCGHGPFTEYKMTAQRIGMVPRLRALPFGLFGELRDDALALNR